MAKKKEIDRLIEKGKEKNYLTFQEIENYLDDEILNINKIEDLYDVLSKYGVDVIDEEEEKEE
jgi:RNA polymerase primary sigma factor